MYIFGETSNKRRAGVDSLLIELTDRALAMMYRKGHCDMTIPLWGGKRSAEEQFKIFQQGNSELDGYEDKSYHQSGLAIDVIPYVNGKGTYKFIEGFFDFAQCMFTVWANMVAEGKTGSYVLEWGGFWGSTGWDKPHWQLVKKT
ncbi:M15 family metallopeptidase [Flammeovirga agarivorans]|uniref:M15 family metallopeptidase n=1 Tax=Flammeovirga agarivorans TaxID=2726742 RepID=A0A7X8XZ93_9BACT|nr:M15 family metallopeptidase [Flammeovirga agarivorans]NLR94951.1 M15 family metallopeptidase [Flammeovirga agarivorans]